MLGYFVVEGIELMLCLVMEEINPRNGKLIGITFLRFFKDHFYYSDDDHKQMINYIRMISKQRFTDCYLKWYRL